MPTARTIDDLPAALAGPALEGALAAFARVCAERPALLGAAPSALAGSPYLANLCVRREGSVRALVDAGALDADADVAARDAALEDVLEARVASLPVEAGDDAAALAALRDLRHAEQFRIVWHAAVHAAPLEDTFRALTALADACVRVGWRRAAARTARRHGRVRDAAGEPVDAVIVAMGKLGGGELNMSSDVDLIALHPPAGDSDGARALSAGEWFARAFRETLRLLSARTVDGICFRTDTRLRPFGDSGPPVTSFVALDAYWREHGRDWERYAMVKARALTGSTHDIRAFESLRLPFVYRRYPDYAVMASLRELKAMIAASAATRGARRRAGATGSREATASPGTFDDDIKLGRGGIREVEFIVQAHQLVRGGREPALTGRALLPMLRELGARGVVPPDDVAALERAYRELRRVENALQAVDDAQTHVLPEDPVQRARVAMLLGAPDFDAARRALGVQRSAVATRFDALFEGEGIGVVHRDATATAESRDDGPGDDPPASEAAPGSVAASMDLDHPALAPLRDGPARRRLPERSAKRLDALLPQVAAAVAARGDRDASALLTRVADFLAAAAGRGGYLQVLLDRPALLKRLVALCAQSAWVARELAAHPVLVETLLEDGLDAGADGVATSTPEGWHAAATSAMQAVPANDLEAAMSALRRFRRAAAFSIVVGRLDGALTLMQSSDRFTWLAEAVVTQVLARVAAPLERRHGVPQAGDGSAVGLAVIAYGKLGGLELGPESDLDLVFLHDEPGEGGGSTDGPEPIPNPLWHARLVRRFGHFMTVRTEAGTLYEIDLRLRPNGTAGMLVTSLEAFAGYQRESAWTWEHQALLRARAVAGQAALRGRFETLRLEILCRERAPDRLASDVVDMRERMLAAHASREPGRMDLKRDPGGLIDVEFVVQYLALRHASEHPEVVRHSDNMRVMEAARDAGLVSADDARELMDAWLALRARALDATLDLEGSLVALDASLGALADRVRALRAATLGPASPVA